MGLFELVLRLKTSKPGNNKKIHIAKNTEERKRTNVHKEDYLMRQIDEFKDKARQLQTLLTSKEKEVHDLENLVSDREEKAQELEELLKVRRSEADELVAGVSKQIQEMMDALDRQMEQFSAQIDGHVQSLDSQVGDKLQAVDSKLDAIKADICDKVHNEDVKCYRNMKSLIEGQAEKFDSVTLSEDSLKTVRKSFKGLKFLAFFAFLDFILLILFALYELGFLNMWF